MDLLAELPKRIKISEEDDSTGKLISKLIIIKYDYIPKYCKKCCLQGHVKKECWVIHPELEQSQQQLQTDREKEPIKQVIGTTANTRKVLSSGKIVGNIQRRQEWMQRRSKYKKDSTGRFIEEEHNKWKENSHVSGIQITNKFATLEKEEHDIDENGNDISQ